MFVAAPTYAQSTHDQGASEILVGIGATLIPLEDKTVSIEELIPGAPAERSGLKVGDIILTVKSLPESSFVDVRALELEQVVALIRGPEGLPVELTVVSPDNELKKFRIIRERFEVKE